jgi:hypothetical protein
LFLHGATGRFAGWTTGGSAESNRDDGDDNEQLISVKPQRRLVFPSRESAIRIAPRLHRHMAEGVSLKRFNARTSGRQENRTTRQRDCGQGKLLYARGGGVDGFWQIRKL